MDETDPYAPWWAGLRPGDESRAPYAEIARALGRHPKRVERDAAKRGLTRPLGRPAVAEARVQVASLDVPASEADAWRARLSAAARAAGYEHVAPWVREVMGEAVAAALLEARAARRAGGGR
jgi:hypothetical protein